MFYFVSYESIRDHRAVDRHRHGAAAGDAAGRSVALADADLRSALRECGRHRADAVPGVPRRSELRAVQHGDEPERA